MRRSVSSPGGGSGPCSAPASAASRSGPTRVRTPPCGSSSNESVTGFAGSPSASSRSTASWRSSSSSKPRSSRSAMPPSTIRTTGSQARPTGVLSCIRSACIDRFLQLFGLLRGLGRGLDRPPSNHGAASHEAGGLPGSGAVDRLVEQDPRAVVLAGHDRCALVLAGCERHLDPARDGRRAVAELHVVDERGAAVKDHGRELEAIDGEGRARPDGHGVRAGVLRGDVERLAGGNAEAAALTDREAVVSVVAPDLAPGAVEDGAWTARVEALGEPRPVELQEQLGSEPREEAEVLALP